MGILSRLLRREDDPVVKAAREMLEDRPWPTERTPSAEVKLVIALYEAFPEDFDTKNKCRCGDRDCDICPTRKELHQRVNGLREELARRRMAAVTPSILEARHGR